MPKVCAKKYRKSIEAELAKWHAKSKMMKTLSHISYGKIKSGLMNMEKTAGTNEMLEFRSEIGKLIINYF